MSLTRYNNNRTFNTLVGLTLVKAENIGDEEIVFKADNGAAFKLYHEQDCCESVYVESVTGDLADLIGSPIIVAEEASANDPNAGESGTWTFYKLATVKGWVDIRFYGSSNGYYSESVSFIQTEEAAS